MRPRCSAPRPRLADRCGRSPAATPHTTDTETCPAGVTVPEGRFVQVLAGELARFAAERTLSFDQRALLEHLLLVVDHRNARLEPFSLTTLASTLGLGPSGRRTLKGYLLQLQAVGAVSMTGLGTDGLGRLEVTAFSALVHRGSDDPRRGFVQLVPAALAELVGRHHLSPTASALLVRLLLLAAARSASVAVAGRRELGQLVGLGTARLERALDELLGAGLLAWPSGGKLLLVAYAQVVRAAPLSASSANAARSRTDRAASESKRAAGPPAARDPLDPLRAEDFQTKPKTTPPTPPSTPVGDDHGRGWGFLVKVEQTLTDAQRQALRTALDRAPLSHLVAELDRLLDGGWEPEALLADVAAALPSDWRSPARLLLARARALPTAPPDPEVLRAAADGARLAAQVEAACAFARNNAAVEYLGADEIVGLLARAYGGAALEAGIAVVAACRPGEGVRVPVGRTDGTDSEPVDEKPRQRRSEPPSPGPVAVGQLLEDLLVNGERRAS